MSSNTFTFSTCASVGLSSNCFDIKGLNLMFSLKILGSKGVKLKDFSGMSRETGIFSTGWEGITLVGWLGDLFGNVRGFH